MQQLNFTLSQYAMQTSRACLIVVLLPCQPHHIGHMHSSWKTTRPKEESGGRMAYSIAGAGGYSLLTPTHRWRACIMPSSSPQYDHIGSLYDDYARTATIRLTERNTMLRMLGELDGQHVLDLACGFGYYTRLLKELGATQVIGVDISPEMIRLARAQEQMAPLGLTYQVGDALTLPPM